MEKVKQTDDYIIYQKRSKRYAVLNNDRKYIQGAEKIKILVSEKLIKAVIPKPKEEEPVEAQEAKGDEAVEAKADAKKEEPKKDTEKKAEAKAEKTEEKVEAKAEEKTEEKAEEKKE